MALTEVLATPYFFTFHSSESYVWDVMKHGAARTAQMTYPRQQFYFIPSSELVNNESPETEQYS